MATWKEIAIDNLAAADALRGSRRWRSSVSRSYYAAYSAVAGELDGKATFPHGMKNPPHESLPALVRTHVTMLTPRDRRRLGAILVRLYANRLDADYRPRHTVDEATTLFSLIDATDALKLLGVL